MLMPMLMLMLMLMLLMLMLLMLMLLLLMGMVMLMMMLVMQLPPMIMIMIRSKIIWHLEMIRRRSVDCRFTLIDLAQPQKLEMPFSRAGDCHAYSQAL